MPEALPSIAPLTSAYLLVAHGSSDPRPQATVDNLAQQVSSKLQHLKFAPHEEARSFEFLFPAATVSTVDLPVPPLSKPATTEADAGMPLVASAYLECHPQPLHEQIYQFGCQARSQGHARLTILPLFLLPGMHVMEDIPTEVELARDLLGNDFVLEIKPYLGTHPNLSRLLATYLATTPAAIWILLAHGSRRSGGNEPIERLAERLGAIAAYWSVEPSLAQQIEVLSQSGHRQISILPYFLFTGGVTDAIAATVEHLSQQFLELDLHLAEPLDTIVELADLAVDQLVN